MSIVLAGKRYEIKQLSAADFLDSPHSVPFCIFEIDKKVKEGMYGQMLDGLDDEVKPDKEVLNDDKATVIRDVINAALMFSNDDLRFTKEDVYNNEHEYSRAYGFILYKQLKAFRDIGRRKVSAYQLEYIANMGQKYGKFPIEVLMPNGGYTELEGFLFNRVATNYLHRQEKKKG